jgi:hypothetical protein
MYQLQIVCILISTLFWPRKFELHYLSFFFVYLGTTVTNQNLIQERIKRRLNSGDGCYHSGQNLLSSRLLSKYIKIIIHKTIILPVVLYGCMGMVSDIKGGKQTEGV